MKACTGCGETKPPSDYQRDTRREGRLKAMCRACCTEKARIWRELNREHYNKYARDRKSNIPDKMREIKKRYYQKNRDAILARNKEWVATQSTEDRLLYQWAYRLQKNFGLTLEDYQALQESQGGVCALCGRPETATHRGKPRNLAVDHCHTTGVVRGLLCFSCNSFLGKFERLGEAASRYLENPPARYLRMRYG